MSDDDDGGDDEAYCEIITKPIIAHGVWLSLEISKWFAFVLF